MTCYLVSPAGSTRHCVHVRSNAPRLIVSRPGIKMLLLGVARDRAAGAGPWTLVRETSLEPLGDDGCENCGVSGVSHSSSVPASISAAALGSRC